MLEKNDIVEVISPATACDLREIREIKNYVKKIGLIPRIFLEKETTLKKSSNNEFSSISPSWRFEQLKKAIEAPDSKIIWCTRGGYGSSEIVPLLMKMKKPKKPKIFIGFSDISSLNIFLIQQWNWKVISAPMLVQLALNKVSSKSKKAVLDLVFGKTLELKYRLTNAKKIELSGEIVGGCISVLSGNFGTKNQVNWKGKILFLEDEGEDGERLDRYFNQISTIIKETKSKPKAVLLGNFLEANIHGTPKAKNIKIAIKKFSKKIATIPLFQEKTKCLGHSKNMMPLFLGVEAKITKDGTFTQKI